MLFRKNKKFIVVNEKVRTRQVRTSGHYRRPPEDQSPNVIGKVFFWSSFTLWLGALVYVLVFSEFLAIKEVRIRGNETLPASAVSEAVTQKLEGTLLRVIPKNNYLLVTKSNIRRALTDNFKRIKSVEIKKTFPSSLAIDITEHEARLVWCSRDECFYIDTEGYAWDQVNFESKDFLENDFVILSDKSSVPVSAGEKILTREYIAFVLELKSVLAEKEELTLVNWQQGDTPSLVSNTVNFTTSEGWRVSFSKDWSAREQIETLVAVLSKKIGDRRNKLEYVDLRVKDKIFFKLSQPEDESAPPLQ